jgi:large subunit ribosomal protein L31
MKKNFHAPLHNVQAACACGKKFEVASVLEELSVDICSGCHPFFTGQQKFVDRAGRIEKFQRRFESKQAAK